ncbi:hypothetical protein KAU39_07265, partial [bacterium]|nr:hypothetical protein [bacterium]
MKKMETEKTSVVAMVTGGFHTPGVTKLAKEKGLSYVVVSPNITQAVDSNRYFALLEGKRTPYKDLLLEQSELLLAIASSFVSKEFSRKIVGLITNSLIRIYKNKGWSMDDIKIEIENVFSRTKVKNSEFQFQWVEELSQEGENREIYSFKVFEGDTRENKVIKSISANRIISKGKEVWESKFVDLKEAEGNILEIKQEIIRQQNSIRGQLRSFVTGSINFLRRGLQMQYFMHLAERVQERVKQKITVQGSLVKNTYAGLFPAPATALPVTVESILNPYINQLVKKLTVEELNAAFNEYGQHLSNLEKYGEDVSLQELKNYAKVEKVIFQLKAELSDKFEESLFKDKDYGEILLQRAIAEKTKIVSRPVKVEKVPDGEVAEVPDVKVEEKVSEMAEVAEVENILNLCVDKLIKTENLTIEILKEAFKEHAKVVEDIERYGIDASIPGFQGVGVDNYNKVQKVISKDVDDLYIKIFEQKGQEFIVSKDYQGIIIQRAIEAKSQLVSEELAEKAAEVPDVKVTEEKVPDVEVVEVAEVVEATPEAKLITPVMTTEALGDVSSLGQVSSLYQQPLNDFDVPPSTISEQEMRVEAEQGKMLIQEGKFNILKRIAQGKGMRLEGCIEQYAVKNIQGRRKMGKVLPGVVVNLFKSLESKLSSSKKEYWDILEKISQGKMDFNSEEFWNFMAVNDNSAEIWKLMRSEIAKAYGSEIWAKEKSISIEQAEQEILKEVLSPVVDGLTEEIKADLRQTSGEFADTILYKAQLNLDFAYMIDNANFAKGLYEVQDLAASYMSKDGGSFVLVRTGGGKTLIGMLPAYLVALKGETCCFVTRDATLVNQFIQDNQNIAANLGVDMEGFLREGSENVVKAETPQEQREILHVTPENQAIGRGKIVVTTTSDLAFTLGSDMKLSENEKVIPKKLNLIFDEVDMSAATQ